MEVHLHIGVPPSGHDDLDPLIGEPLEGLPARRGRLEDVDAVECPTPVEHLGKRLSDVPTDVEHDPTHHRADDAMPGVGRLAQRPAYPERDERIRLRRQAGRASWSVTTVIPTFDAASSLASTLDALTALDLPSGGTLEIVVSDDGSTDRTIEVASGYPNVRVVRGERCGPAGARNRGAGAGSGEILAFVDSGDVPSEPWLRQIVATFQDPLVGMASWPAWVVERHSAASSSSELAPVPRAWSPWRRASPCGAASSMRSAGTTPTCAVARTPTCVSEQRCTASLMVVASSAPTRPRRASSSVVRRRTTTGRDSTPRSTSSSATPTNSASTGREPCASTRSPPSTRHAVATGRVHAPTPGRRWGAAEASATWRG